MAYGCPLQAIVAAFGIDERTVGSWQQRAGAHCQQVHQHLVQQPRDLGQVQADEIRVKYQGGIGWMAMATAVPTRLWLAGVVSVRRNGALIRRLIQQVRQCASMAWLPMFRRFGKFFASPSSLARLRLWHHLCIVQVIKQCAQKQPRRVIGIVRRIVCGTS